MIGATAGHPRPAAAIVGCRPGPAAQVRERCTSSHGSGAAAGRGGRPVSRACITFDKGCPRVAVDVALLFEYFEANGWELVDDVEDADLILAAGCAVHQGAEDSGFAALAHIDARRKKGSRLVAIGCLPGICEERLRNTYDALALPPVKAHLLDEIIGARVKLADMREVPDIAPYTDRARRSMGRAGDGPARRLARDVAHALGLDVLRRRLRLVADRRQSGSTRICSLRVAWGCAGECSYCAIRFAAGPLRSKPLDAILAEFDAGLGEGFTRFELIAGDVGCWGQDAGASVIDLFDGLFGSPNGFRLIIDDFNPRWLLRYKAALVPLLAANSGRIESILLPVQSGSLRILSLMRRGYSTADVVKGLAELRAAAPDLNMITHVLVGFPGETDADFDDTRNLLRAVRFDRIDAYPYADRPNTPAGQLPDKVPKKIIEARCSFLEAEFPTVVVLYI